MHVVAIAGWKEENNTALASTVAQALKITAYEVQQRLIAGSPIVLTTLADAEQAFELKEKLDSLSVSTWVFDPAELRGRGEALAVRRFELGAASIRIESNDGQAVEVPYTEIDILLPAKSSVTQSGMKTVTERKFSLGKTLVAGGIPMSKKVVRQQDVSVVTPGRAIYLYVHTWPLPIVFSQEAMTYEGLGVDMKLSRQQNFTYLIGELRRRSPLAAYDDRLLQQFGQTRLLGPRLKPETYLDLAVEILAWSLRLP